MVCEILLKVVLTFSVMAPPEDMEWYVDIRLGDWILAYLMVLYQLTGHTVPNDDDNG
jgi:hypothetical protein